METGKPIAFFRSGYIGIRKDRFPSLMHHDYYALGKFVARVHDIQHRVQTAETSASASLLVSALSISMILFGCFLFNPLLNTIIMLFCGAFSAKQMLNARSDLKRLDHMAQQPAAAEPLFGKALSGSEAFLLFLERLDERAAEYTVFRRTLWPQGSGSYAIKNLWFWGLCILVPIYFGFSLTLSIINGENGWYNFVGRNYLGW